MSTGAIGYEVICALEILKQENIFPAHFDMMFLKPLDTELLDKIFQKYSFVVIVEDNALQGGFGSLIAEYAVDNYYNTKIKRLGIPDKFIEHGTQQDLYKLCGYDSNAIVKVIKDYVKK